VAEVLLGQGLNVLHQPREALERCRSAEEPLVAAYGPNRRGEVLECQGVALLGLGRAAEATPVLARALAGMAEAQAPPDRLAAAQVALAQAVHARR
jgi:hypothetical protein